MDRICFLTETNSHHTVQILKPFIFCTIWHATNILLNLVFMHNTAVQKFYLFEFMGIVNLNATMTCIHMQYHEYKMLCIKKSLFISNECASLCKNGFVLIQKLSWISCKKCHFVQNHATVVHVLTNSWKTYSG